MPAFVLVVGNAGKYVRKAPGPSVIQESRPIAPDPVFEDLPGLARQFSQYLPDLELDGSIVGAVEMYVSGRYVGVSRGCRGGMVEMPQACVSFVWDGCV